MAARLVVAPENAGIVPKLELMELSWPTKNRDLNVQVRAAGERRGHAPGKRVVITGREAGGAGGAEVLAGIVEGDVDGVVSRQIVGDALQHRPPVVGGDGRLIGGLWNGFRYHSWE